MADEYTLPLADPRTTLENVGGKGASLARLVNAGLPVPGGFHVTTDAYRRFVADNDLQPTILEAVRGVNPAQPSTLETASRTMVDLFVHAPMPRDVADAIARAYADLPGLSFAGQQETYLNIHGLAAVQDAVKRCWASLWTARAIGYRAQHGIDQGSVSLAVVTHLLVPAEAAGVLFTANPVNGVREQAMITATWGLGEAIVGGMVTPDTLTVAKASGRVISRETADKQVMTVRTADGTEEQSTPEALRRAPVLDDQQAAELTRLGVQIEALYGIPMDIEWAMTLPSPAGRGARGEGKLPRPLGEAWTGQSVEMPSGTSTGPRGEGFAILQARPITALPPEPAAPLEWRLPKPRGKYARSSIIELLPEPLTPLFATLGLEEINRGYQRLGGALFRGPNVLPESMVVLINDYAYYDIAFSARQVLLMLIQLPFLAKTLLSSADMRWKDQASFITGATIPIDGGKLSAGA